jgi:hypothetical protein
MPVATALPQLPPLLAVLEFPPPRTVSDDFCWLYDNLRLLEAELDLSA